MSRTFSKAAPNGSMNSTRRRSLRWGLNGSSDKSMSQVWMRKKVASIYDIIYSNRLSSARTAGPHDDQRQVRATRRPPGSRRPQPAGTPH